MPIYIVQLNRKQGQLLLPNYEPIILNAKSETGEALQTAIPSICLLPRGGYWFDVIAKEEDKQAFIAFAKKKNLMLNHSIKRDKTEERREELDLTGFGEVGEEDSTAVKLGVVIPRAKTRMEREIEKQERELLEFSEMIKTDPLAKPRIENPELFKVAPIFGEDGQTE